MIRYDCSYVTRYYFRRDKIGKYIANESFRVTSSNSGWMKDICNKRVRGK